MNKSMKLPLLHALVAKTDFLKFCVNGLYEYMIIFINSGHLRCNLFFIKI